MSSYLIIDDVIAHGEALFQDFAPVLCLPGKNIHPHDNPQACAHANGLIIRSRTQVNKTLLSACPQLSFIGSTVVGLDHIDFDALRQYPQISFYSAQGCNANSVAEYILVNACRWIADRPLKDITLGVIGVGHVGRLVVQKAQALGMTVLQNDPPRAEITDPADPHYLQDHIPLDELLPQCDILTLHTPLTTNGSHPTWHLLNSEKLKRIGYQTLTINAARGGIIDEAAWLRHPGQKIVDCWQEEPNISTALLQQAWLATPHIAGHSINAKWNGAVMCLQALARHRQHSQPVCQLTDYVATDGLSLPPPPPWVTGHDFYQWIRPVYPFEQDDRVLRQAQHLPKQFEIWRRQYPLRFEWSSVMLTLTTDTPPQQYQQCLQLGFQPQISNNKY